MAKVSILSPGGYPKKPYGSFTGKPTATEGIVSVLGSGGYPRPPYQISFFMSKTPSTTTTVHDHPFLATVGRLMGIP